MLTMFGGGLKREILFRAKRLPGLLSSGPDPDEWLYGYIQVQRMREDDIDTLTWIHEQEAPFKRYAAKPWTVGQYTGATDKNGVKIFEGDILEFVEESGAVYHDEVIWYDMMSGFKHVTEDGHPLTLFDEIAVKCTVIGNIYDNPELLGGDVFGN